MKRISLVPIISISLLVFAFCPDKASASTKEEEYDELNAFFIENDAMDEENLRNLTNPPKTDPEELKYAVGKFEVMQERLKSDYSKLQDCLARVQAGNFIFIDFQAWETPPKFTVSSLTNQEYYDKSTDAVNYPTIKKTNYIRAVDVSTKYVKEEAPRRLKQIEKLLEKTEKWKTYYLGKGEKPTEPSQPTEAANTDKKSLIEAICQKIDTFLAENRQMYAKDLSDLINSPTTNSEEINKILAGLKRLEQGLEPYRGKLQDCIAKTKDGNYVTINLHRWPAFMPQLTVQIILKDEYIDQASDAALNPAPAKTNFIFMADASTEYIKKEGIKRLKEIEKLLEEVKDWKSYYLNQLAKLTQQTQGDQGAGAASTASPEWAIETIIDPDKKIGTPDEQGDIWTMQSPFNASATNKKFPLTKKTVNITMPLPLETKGNEWFKFTVTVACDTQDQGSCQVYPQVVRAYCMVLRPIDTPETSQMNFFVRAYGKKGEHAETSTTFIAYIDEACYKSCSGQGSAWDPIPSVAIINKGWGGDWTMVKYIYKKKESAKELPVSSVSPKVTESAKQASVEEGVESILSNLSVPSMEPDAERPGMDYDSFELSADEPKQCQNACAMDTKCKAYTYVKPGIQGKARCYLKNGVPSSRKNNSCISGVKP